MRAWTRRPGRPLERWRGLDRQRQRELRLAAADWLYTLLPLPFSLLFQIQSLDGWGLWGGALSEIFDEHSARYGAELPGLLYFLLPVLCAAAATVVRRTHPLWLMSIVFVLLLGFANLIPAPARRRSPGTGRTPRTRTAPAGRAGGGGRTHPHRPRDARRGRPQSQSVLHAGGLEVSTTDQRAVEVAELIRHTGRQALGELRDIFGVLREYSAKPPPTSGFGLSGLRERLAALGGELFTGSRPDGGWRLGAELVIQEEPA